MRGILGRTALLTLFALLVLLSSGCDGRRSLEYEHHPPVSNAHPYLIADREDIERVIEASAGDGYAPMMRRLAARADGHLATGLDELMDLPLYSRAPKWRDCLLELWLAWRLGGDERYRSHMYGLVEGLHSSKSMGLTYFAQEHPIGGITATLSLIYDLDYERSSPEQKAMLEEMLRAFGRDLYERSMHESFGEDSPRRYAWNHAAVAYSGLGLAALALGNPDDETDLWLGRAQHGVGNYIRYGITEDGVAREGFRYAGYGMGSAAWFLAAMQSVYADDTIKDERLGRYIEWFAYETLSGGGRLNNRNDSYLNPALAMDGYLVVAKEHNVPAAAWAWSRLVGRHGARSFEPLFESLMFYPGDATLNLGLENGRYFEDAGLIASRAGWKLEDAVFVFTSGDFIGDLHDHSDENSFTLSAYGIPMLIDSGASNDPSAGSAVQTVGHNCILIDGKGMAPSGGGLGTSGAIVEVKSKRQVDLALGDASGAYNRDGFNEVEKALRYICFVKRPMQYLVTYDDIKKPGVGEHSFEYLLHLYPTLTLDTGWDGEGYVYRDPEADAGIHVLFLNPAGISRTGARFVNSRADVEIEGHPLERFSTEAVEPGFVAVMIPFEGERPPGCAASAIVDDDRVTVSVKFHRRKVADEITFVRSETAAGERLVFNRIRGVGITR